MNLAEFHARLTRAAEGPEAERFFRQCADGLSGEVLRLARKYTPTGLGVFEVMDDKEDAAANFSAALTGRKRASYYTWKHGDLVKSSAKKNALKLRRVRSGGELWRNWFAIPARRSGDRYTAAVHNDTYYAYYVEYGHRQHVGQFVPVLGKRLKRPWVPGRFMLRRSHEEVQGLARAYLERKLHAFLSGSLQK